MSEIRIKENIFLGLQEYNRILRFLQIDGLKQRFLFDTATFGLLKGYQLPNGIIIDKADVFKINNENLSVNYKVNINPGRAIDKNGNILTLNEQKTLEIPDNGQWYTIVISHKYSNLEEGVVNISETGELTGNGTYFDEVLRGQPNFPVKIKFENSLNNGEYEVVTVIDREQAILSGEFVAEQNLRYKVIGTFTPGAPTVPYLYYYDDIDIQIIRTSELNTGTNILRQNIDFIIAEVRTVGQNVEIKDKRTEWWTTQAQNLLELLGTVNNPLIGVEAVKWDLMTTPRDKNEINIAWVYRSTNWSIDTTQNVVTISSGKGGIFKENDLSLFQNGQFDGWRLYTKSGKYFTVVSSSKSGSQLNLKLDALISTEFSTGDELLVTPDVDFIEIKLNYDAVVGVNSKLTETFLFPINEPIGKIYARITDSDTKYKYNLTYRYKVFGRYTDWLKFNDDEVGYYDESSFDENGQLNANPIDRTLKPYTASLTDGFIELTPNPRNYNILFQEIMTGDKFGVDHKNITNATPVTHLIVGRDRQMQVLHFNDVVLNNDIFVNLKKQQENGNDCVNGNRFVIQIQGDIDLNGRNLKIVTDYVDPTNYTLVRDINERDIAFIKRHRRLQSSGLTMIFNYDGSEWWLAISNEYGTPIGSIVAYSGDITDFDSSGLGMTPNTLGWAICNGNNGTENLIGRVINGTDPGNPSAHKQAGGNATKPILRENLPNYQLPVTQLAHHHQIPASPHQGESGLGWMQQNNEGSDWRNTTNETIEIYVWLGGQNVPLNVMQPYRNLLYIQKII